MTVRENYPLDPIQNPTSEFASPYEEHQTISAKGPVHESMDYDFLRRKGIEYVQRLSGKIWTDYNEHDPGVTILEQLCFALTDLGYRSNFSVEDILFSKRHPLEARPNNAFFSPQAIFPSAPLSLNDYRKLLIDQVLYVKNAWLEIDETNLHGYKGLYNVRLQLWDNLSPEKEKATIEEVYELLNAHRNLCTDIVEISVLATDKIGVAADISINTNAIGEVVFAEIIHQLEKFLNPVVQLYSLEELLKEGKTIDEILEGPLPAHGFIKTEELAALHSEIYISSFIEIISKVEGVEEVQNLVVTFEGQSVDENVIVFAEGRHPVLDENMYRAKEDQSSLRMYRGDVKIDVDSSRVQQLLNLSSAKDRKNFKLSLNLDPQQTLVRKPLGQIEQYVSLQNYFPQVYGIGHYGLPYGADAHRAGQAKQLKGYLSIFEQILANYLSQLANIRHLFSIEDETNATYFSQLPRAIPQLKKLLAKKTMMRTEKWLEQRTRQTDPYFDRRNRFLDHLLARFGEQFNVDHLLKMSGKANGENANGEVQNGLIRAKAKMLRDFPRLSADRGKGFNYQLPAWSTDNVAELKKKIAQLLNIEDAQNRRLTKLAAFEGLKMTEPKERTNQFGYGFLNLKLSLREMLSLGVQEYRYRIEYDVNTRNHWVYFKTRKGKPLAVYKEKTLSKCEQAISKMIERFQKINRESEGFFLIENILLRSRSKAQWNLTLLDMDGSPILTTIKSGSYQDQEEIAFNILLLGTHRDNYEIQKNGAACLLILRNYRKEAIMVSVENYREEEVEAKINTMVEMLNAIRQNDPVQVSNLLRFEEVDRGALEHSRAFYSNRLSVIIPAWPGRFQNKDFRSNFEHLLRINAPVHLAINFFWLSFQQMQNFEKNHQLWIEELTRKDSIPQKLDDFSFHLASLLNSYKTSSLEKAREDARPQQVDRNRAILGHFHVFQNENLQIIEGIGPEIEQWLKKQKIHNWQALAHSSIEDLKSIVEAIQPGAPFQQYANWSDQAWLAQEGKWNQLIAYQRLLSSRKRQHPDENLPSKIEKMIIEIFGPEIKSNDLKIIYGITPKVEKILKEANVNSLATLAGIELNTINNILASAGIQQHFINPESWNKQAQLALNKEYDDLWSYQKSLHATRDMLDEQP
ncbi:MAG: hypothetical protein AAF985_00035 [Bacteroidota bacterium]